MQHMDLQRRETRFGVARYVTHGAGRYAGRQVLVAPNRAFLDTQQTAWVTLPEGSRSFETQPGDWTQVITSAR
jgi:hypothetical protein